MSILNRFREAINPSLTFTKYDLAPYQKVLEEINSRHQNIRNYSDQELQKEAQQLKNKAKQSWDLNDLLPLAYALVKEVCIRQLELHAFDVQMLAAIALHQGELIEMKTGEGKTLAAVFPVFLNAISGKGVNVLTFNDYLAKRDATQMKKVYEFLGLTVGYIAQTLSPAQRKLAYHCDITYATAKEIGFDYLRSFIAIEPDEIVQRPFHYCIVDEADAILIDEARTPLVLAGSLVESTLDHYHIAGIVKHLEEKDEFELDDNGQNVFLTEKGIKKIETSFELEDLHAEENFELQSAINLALHARVLLQKDIDYIVKDGEVKLIDEFTGRVVKDRKWRNGLQTAVEAKEGLEIQSEGMILNSISLQHLLHKYPKIAGMTATAQQSSEEFFQFYGLPTVVIPPNKKSRRVDHPDRIFTSTEAKRKALIQEVQKTHQKGQPVLIGTLNVKESEKLAEDLKSIGLKCNVLNAKNDEKEAEIIADAGKVGAITISTNMAGRGTDIMLGGKNAMQKEKVVALGGLYVIGTNKHESARIDRQLKGRAGRQGDIGKTCFFVSFEDELMVRYQLKEILPKKYRELQSDQAITDIRIASFLNQTQKIIEGRFFDMRKTLYEYSSFLEKQRILFQEERQKFLFSDSPLLEKNQALKKKKGSMKKARSLVLFDYDKCWADHLDYMSQVREGIHLQRFGGRNPLSMYRKKADEHFQMMKAYLEQEMNGHLKQLLKNPALNPEDLGMNRPAATWTYIINDNTFGDQLSIMLLDNSNIGFQVDFISAFFLAIFSAVKRMKNKKR